MVDPGDIAKARERAVRIFEILAELGRPGADHEALLAEHEALAAQGETYVAGLQAEIEAGHIIRREAVEVQREEMAPQLDLLRSLLPADLPADDPKRRIVELLSKYVSGEMLTADEQAWLESQMPDTP